MALQILSESNREQFQKVSEDDGNGSDGGGVVTKETDTDMDSSMNTQHTMNNNNNNNVDNKEVPSVPKKRHVIKIKLPALQNQGKDLNNLQAVAQQITKPTIEVEAHSTLVKPTSQEAVVKGGGGDRPNKVKQDLEEEKFQLKLEATKRKLQERYKQAQHSKKRIRLVELQDVPKQKLPDGSNKKPRNRYRW